MMHTSRIAVYLALGSLSLLLLWGCRSQLPIQFRQQPGGGYEGGDDRSGGDPQEFYPAEGDEGASSWLSASYDRLAQVLTVELDGPEDVDVTVEVTAPDWISFPAGLVHEGLGGKETLALAVILAEEGPDEGDVGVTATDSVGSAASATVVVERPLFITRAWFAYSRAWLEDNEPSIHVEVDEAYGCVVTAALTLPAGVMAGDSVPPFSGGGEIVFPLTLSLGMYESAEVLVEVADQYGHTDSETITVTSWKALPGVLLAIPLHTSATVGWEVTVVVASGPFPTEAPFAYMDGAGVTAEEGARYVADSFNVGEPGGERDFPDGIWATMDPLPIGYVMAPDFMMEAQSTEVPGIVRIDFNVTPIYGGDTTTAGVLFNFALEFDHPGTYTLGFQFFEDVRRTYYSDEHADTHEWLDISNDHPGVPNQVVVE